MTTRHRTAWNKFCIALAAALTVLGAIYSALSAQEIPPAATPVVIPTATSYPRPCPCKVWVPLIAGGQHAR